MNERIKELARQATEHDHTTWDSYNQKELVYYKFNKEKFAELIIRECMSITERCMDDDTIFALNGAEIIAEHFGVEE